jgi:ATP-dependent Clp protease ATP-binding subunit ClpA
VLSKVFGQDHAVKKMIKAIKVAKAGLRKSGKPIGNFLLVGPTGVGKTEVCKRLAEALNTKLVRFDMSEYMEKHTVSKFIGAPPGYVGHGEGTMGDGQLITEIEQNPNCVLLLDEVEKAHPEVFNIMLQVMDEGHLTSSKSKKVHFDNVTVVMTTNLGAADAEKRTIGFSEEVDEYHSDAMMAAVKKHFSPEFRNRLDEVVEFNKLTPDVIRMIVDSQISMLNEQVADKDITIAVTAEAREWLAKEGHDPLMGARPLERLIQKEISEELSEHILYGDLLEGGHALIDYKDGKMSITAKQKVESFIEPETTESAE